MVKVLEILVTIALLKGAYYDSQLGIVPAAIDLLLCLAMMVWEIEKGIRENDRIRKNNSFRNVCKR